MIDFQKAILPAKEAEAYVSGKINFALLLEKHGDILKPFRRTPRGDTFYRRKTIDAACAEAEAQGTLVEEKDESKRPGTRRK